jgi:hypothetical protein
VIRTGAIVFLGWTLVSFPAALLFGLFLRASRRSWRAPDTVIEDDTCFVETVGVPIVNPDDRACAYLPIDTRKPRTGLPIALRRRHL